MVSENERKLCGFLGEYFKLLTSEDNKMTALEATEKTAELLQLK